MASECSVYTRGVTSDHNGFANLNSIDDLHPNEQIF